MFRVEIFLLSHVNCCLKIHHSSYEIDYIWLVRNLTHSTKRKKPACLSSAIFELHFTVFGIPFYGIKNSIRSVQHQKPIQNECTTRGVSISLFINKLRKAAFPHARSLTIHYSPSTARRHTHTKSKCQYKNGKSH